MEQLSDQSREFQRALTTWMIDQRAGGVFCPEVTPSVVNFARAKRNLSVIERVDRLLTFLVDEASELGQEIEFTDLPPDVGRALGLDEFLHPHTQSHRTNLLAYAWSESDDWDAVKSLLDYLERRGFVNPADTLVPQQGVRSYSVTVEGYARVNRSITPP